MNAKTHNNSISPMAAMPASSMPMAVEIASTLTRTASNLINLQSLIDLSAALNASDDDSFILNTALLSVMGKLRTFKACALVPDDSHLADSATATLLWKSVASKGLHLPTATVELSMNLDSAPELGIALIQTVRSVTASELERLEFRDVEPMNSNTNGILALLCFGTNLTKMPYTDEEQQYISLVGSITANALLNAANIRTLRETGSYLERKNQLLTTLFEINREFTALLNKDDIVKFLMLRLMGQLAVSRFAVLVKSNDGNISNGLPQAMCFEIVINRLKMTTEQAAELATAFTSEGAKALTRCPEIISDCVLAAPMNTQNETKGVLLVGEKMNKQPFTAEEQNFLEALGGTAMTALENARLFHEELEKKRMEDELRLARSIQKGLLPQELPQIEGFDVAAMSVSSKQIGGDYYDVIPLGEGEWLLVIADVSGKGTPAALLMANTQAALRVLAPLRLPLSQMVSRINDLLYSNTSDDKFVTFFCGILSTRLHTFTFTNAGHNPPLLLRSTTGIIEKLSEGGLILGIMEAFMPYEEKTVDFYTGDVLLCFTDGVSEALNEANEEFTEECLEAHVKAFAYQTARTIVEQLTYEVQRHVAGAAQSDDITMLVVKCT
jgi:phosphoserine phosphatase RsbU/P